MNILAGLIEPDSGTLLLGTQRVPHYREHIAYMQQKDLLLPWRNVLDNAILGLELQGLPRQQAHAQAQALLERFGLGGFERAYPHQLSGGMRQRVALVRTLLLQKPIWLLDEPFGALDAMTRSQLHRYLLQAWHDQETIALFVTHDIEEALVLADGAVGLGFGISVLGGLALEATRWQILRKLRLPAALPFIFSGVKLRRPSLSVSLRGSMEAIERKDQHDHDRSVHPPRIARA